MEIIFVACVAILLTFLIWMIMRDGKNTKRYRAADTCTGIVLENLGSCRIDNYGSGISGVQKRTYYKYQVEYDVCGRSYRGILISREQNLVVGSPVTVKFGYNEETGQPVLLNSISSDRTKQLLFGVVGGSILAAVLMYLKTKGLM